jgi:hypothetical protein
MADDSLGVIDTLVRNLRPDVGKSSSGFTLAQAVAHCAQSIECSMRGYPKLRSGLFRATIGPLVKRKFIRAGRMSHDLAAQIPGAPLVDAGVAFEEAQQRALAAVDAFRKYDGALSPHLAYGACTKDEYATLHRLHVEDHLRGLGVLDR